MASVHARRVAAEDHARCIPPLATALLTAARSRSSRSGSVGDVSSPPRTAHLPPRQQPGKEKASDSGAAAGEKELGYQSPARELKGVYHGDDSDSDNGDRRKKL